ncbi:hypothetical protein Syun_018801 [Stephania yunnanensis]|uniref:Uncharacterized protein n=1 Tax=Stephania yunnanensis TaxID=152371 RepID=A0AAP0ISX8_9MAGN
MDCVGAEAIKILLPTRAHIGFQSHRTGTRHHGGITLGDFTANVCNELGVNNVKSIVEEA